jgi:EAL domain-containing protein (putative c-di-GMP-specific phosphodiesterase class I)
VSKINQLLQHDEFYHFYQPIYGLSNKEIRGYESLIRTSHYNNIEELFLCAKKEDRLHELDIRSISKAISFYYKYNKREVPLFINVYPSTLLNSSFQSFLSDHILSNPRFTPDQIVFEIIEENVELHKLKSIISQLKELGFIFAIDDVGKGSSTLTTIIELEPNYIKMDAYFSKNLSTSKQKQKMLKTLLDYCEKDIVLILEGIEEESDLSMAETLGVRIGQGYLLGRPDALENMI